jgi:hypothetical protein
MGLLVALDWKREEGVEYVRVWGAWLEGSGSGEGGGDESSEGEEVEVYCKVSLDYCVKSDEKFQYILRMRK